MPDAWDSFLNYRGFTPSWVSSPTVSTEEIMFPTSLFEYHPSPSNAPQKVGFHPTTPRLPISPESKLGYLFTHIWPSLHNI